MYEENAVVTGTLQLELRTYVYVLGFREYSGGVWRLHLWNQRELYSTF